MAKFRATFVATLLRKGYFNIFILTKKEREND